MSNTPTRAAIAAASAMLAFASAGVFTSSPAAAKNLIADCAKFVDGWKAAYNAKDADALASMYDPKATYSSVFWTGTGRAVLTQGFKQEFMSGTTMTSIKCEASNMTGDVGVANGTWSASSKGPDGKDISIGGHWLSSYEGHGGKYLLLEHTSNMQLPPPK